MIFLLHRVQSRIRGLIVRNKVRSAAGGGRMPKSNNLGRDNYGKFHYITYSKIVRKK
jgi:hypothetical protein